MLVDVSAPGEIREADLPILPVLVDSVVVLVQVELDRVDFLGPRVDVQIMDPGKYEVTKDQTFVVRVHLKLKDGRWMVMGGEGPETDNHEVKFRMWTYDEQVDLKKKSTTFDGTQRVHMIDNDALNQLKVMKFLLSWTFDRDNARLKLHRVQGALTDESWEVFKRLQQNIIAYILGEMNQVYEWNG